MTNYLLYIVYQVCLDIVISLPVGLIEAYSEKHFLEENFGYYNGSWMADA